MGGILVELAAQGVREVEHAGFTWRVRRVRTADLFEVGVAALQVSPEGIPKPSNGGGLALSQDNPLATLGGLTPEQAGRLGERMEAAVCAGLVAVGRGGQWDEVRVLADARRCDPAQGTLHVTALPPGTVPVLFGAIMELSSGTAEERAALASFRAGAGDAAGGGSGSDPVPPAAA